MENTDLLTDLPLSIYSADGQRKRSIGKITSVQVAEDGTALVVNAEITDSAAVRLLKGDISDEVPG